MAKTPAKTPRKAAPKKKPHGNATPNMAKIKDDICAWIESGQTLADFCRLKGMPSRRSIYFWMEDDAEFAARFARAREVGFDAIAEDTVRIMDEDPERIQEFDAEGNLHPGRVDAGFVQWQKARVDLRLKLLSKWDPKRYGDKLALGQDGPIQIEVKQTFAGGDDE